MKLYTANEKDVDIDSLELMYIYIDSYKVFQKIGFCLHPAYETTETIKDNQLVVTFSEKNDFVDLFEKEKINVKIICGKNGCGKSSLAQVIRNETERCVYVFKDSGGNFYSSSPINIIMMKDEKIEWKKNLKNVQKKGISFLFLSEMYTNIHLLDSRIEKKLMAKYLQSPSLFDSSLELAAPLFTRFKLVFHSEAINDFFAKPTHLLNEVDRDSISKMLEEDWVIPYIMACLTENVYLEFSDKIWTSESDFMYEVTKAIKDKKMTDKLTNLREEQKQFFDKSFSLEEYFNIEKDLSLFSNRIIDFINELSGLNVSYEMIDSLCDFVWSLGFAEINGNERYFNDLSSGERIRMSLISDLYERFVLELSEKKRYMPYEPKILIYDEFDNGLHPEWCRQFLFNYTSAYQAILGYLKEKRIDVPRISVFFITHSPFILSDVTNDYVVYLEKQEDGCSHKVLKEKNSFAGNIGEMFSTNFFMDDTIGKYATKMIKDAICFMNEGNIEKKEWCKKICNSVGDDILKALLLEKWSRQYEEN